MRRIERVTGRSDDMMIVRGVNVFPTQIEELILKHKQLSPHYFVELRRQDRLDDLTVVVEARPDVDTDGHKQTGEALKHDIKSLIGISANVKVMVAGSVERSAGKAKRIIDLRK